ncbi:MAG: hypothetical protein H0X26_07835 [Alphaproteobacteria bacterium]|nr:hypothetical protein [Alphaproteobacteria bacterium]
MNTNDLKQHEFENDIQRFMQIRDQVHDEIKKIAVHVATLDSTNKRFVAHFDVFQKLAKTSEDQVYAAIKAAALDLNRESLKAFSPLIEDLLREQILQLNASVKTAEKALCTAVEEKNKRPFLYVLLWWLFLTTAGFGVGTLVSRKFTPVLPDSFIQKVDLIGKRLEVLSRKDGQVRERKR